MQSQLEKILTTTVKNAITKEQNKNNDETTEEDYKTKSILGLLKEVQKEHAILSKLLLETGYTGIDDNFCIRERLNTIIYQIRRAQDIVIKIKAKIKRKKEE